MEIPKYIGWSRRWPLKFEYLWARPVCAANGDRVQLVDHIRLFGNGITCIWGDISIFRYLVCSGKDGSCVGGLSMEMICTLPFRAGSYCCLTFVSASWLRGIVSDLDIKTHNDAPTPVLKGRLRRLHVTSAINHVIYTWTVWLVRDDSELSSYPRRGWGGVSK